MLNLKVNDQKPPKNKPTIETDLSEAAEKSDPPYSQEYFDLMDMIDNTDKQIDYYKWYIPPRSTDFLRGGTV